MGRKGLRQKPPKWQHPDNAQRSYVAALLELVRKARSVMRERLPALKKDIEYVLESHPRADAEADDDSLQLRTLTDSIRAIFNVDVSQKAAQNMTSNVTSFNLQQFRKIVSSVLGVDIVASEPWLAPLISTTVAANVSLIGSIGQQLSTQVEQIILSAYSGSVRVEDLSDQIEQRFNVSESRAKFIARDQTSKLNGRLTKLRQQNIGGEEYIWRTAMDERVRPTHAAHEGKKFKWSAPPADTGNPGDDYECRCYAEMVFPTELTSGSLEGDEADVRTQDWKKMYFGDDDV